MNARALTEALAGKWHGGYGTAKCPAHDDRTPSLSVRDAGNGRVLVHCHTGCEQEAVLDALRGRGLWDGDRHSELTDDRRFGTPRRRRPKPDDNPNGEAALRIWHESKPALGTLVQTPYLRNRAITLPPPPSLRYHPALNHGPTGLLLPAMIGGVQGPDGKIRGIHRTYLRGDGETKAPVSQAKMMLGKCAGGAVRLAKAGKTLAIGEGIETALSVQQETGIPTWAALSTSGLKALILPSDVRGVVIFADADEAGEKAAQEAARRFSAEGRTVRIARPPEGAGDFNDILQKEAAHE